jgi:hypothetical protein
MAKAKAVSLYTVAKVLGISSEKVGKALTNDPRLTREECAEIQAKALELGYKKGTPGLHHNSVLSHEKAAIAIEGEFLGKPKAQISREMGVSSATGTKYIKGLEVPLEYPESEEDWRSQVTHFMEVALWKGTKRLAQSGMEEMQAHQIPISAGILTDKLAMMKGQPTSFSVQVHQTINHREFLDELKGAKQAQVINADGSEA